MSLTLRVVASRPHSTDAFTEGLLFADRTHLYESTGRYGKSEIREVDLATGKVGRHAALASTDFGEGLARVGSRLLQLTYREHHAWSWSITPFRRRLAFTYAGEGWGLSYSSARSELVMSNGTSRLTLIDPRRFRVVGSTTVTASGRPFVGLNELEIVGTTLWANVFTTDLILRIDLESGDVTGIVNASALRLIAHAPTGDVFNGIAHRPGDPANVLWVTGKNWPKIFQVEIDG